MINKVAVTTGVVHLTIVPLSAGIAVVMNVELSGENEVNSAKNLTPPKLGWLTSVSFNISDKVNWLSSIALFSGRTDHLNDLLMLSDSEHLTDISSPGHTWILLGLNSADLLPVCSDIQAQNTLTSYNNSCPYYRCRYACVSVFLAAGIGVGTLLCV